MKNTDLVALSIYELLNRHYKIPDSFLDYRTPFQFVVAVVLSQQCRDDMVNRISPQLFKQFSTIEAFANASLSALQEALSAINYRNTKAQYIKAISQKILVDHQGNIPNDPEILIRLPGIGQKSVNAILSQLYQIPAITVDTHVMRLSKRMGFSLATNPLKIESDLIKLWPKSIWILFSKLLIMHGRAVCKARTPICLKCMIQARCPQNI